MAANIAVLKEVGVPAPNISFSAVYYDTVCHRCDKYCENVNKVFEMGFDPSKFIFVNVLRTFCYTTQSSRQEKMDVYRRWCWSEAEIPLAFRSHPEFIHASEKHVTKVLDLLVNKMGWPSAICNHPVAICHNLEKGCSKVFGHESSELIGLVKKNLRLGTFLKLTERDFLNKFVIRYQNDIPQLLDMYQGKVAFPELGFGLEETVTSGMKL